MLKQEIYKFNDTKIMLDELPFGLYCEIEGSRKAIRELTKVLQLNLRKCEARDYPTFMKEHIKLSHKYLKLQTKFKKVSETYL